MWEFQPVEGVLQCKTLSNWFPNPETTTKEKESFRSWYLSGRDVEVGDPRGPSTSHVKKKDRPVNLELQGVSRPVREG